MASKEAEALQYPEPRRKYRIIRQRGDQRVFYEGFTPETDEEFGTGPEPLLIQADKQHGGTGPYLYQIKDTDDSAWRTVRHRN